MQKLVRFLNSPWRFFRDVKKVYGGKYLVYQFCAYCLVIGFLFKSTRFNVYPYMKKHGSTSNEIQFYSMIMKVPFNLQPAIGLLADIYPLFGYYKRFYVLIASLLGTLALLVLSFVNLGKTMLVFPFLMLFNFAHIATVLLLSNTKYIQIANSVPNFKRHMVSLAMGLRFTGSLAGNYVGYFVTKHDPINVFRIGSVFSFSIILPVLLGFIPEEKVSNPKIEREKLSKKKAMYSLAMITAVSTIVLIVISSFENILALVLYSVGVVIVLFVAIFKLIDLDTARICVYVFIQNATVVDYFSVRNDWLLANDQCFSGAPNFSTSFLFTTSQFVGNVSGLVATLVFQRALKTLYVVNIFLISVILRMVGFVVEITMIFRKNKLLGISDQLMFITSNEVFWNLARAFSNIGIVMLISKKRGDDMQVSFVSTFESMGYAYAGALGIILTDFLKVDGDARPCRFQNYWIMSLVGSCILPATTLLFMFWVIPRFKIPGDDGKEESEISRNSKSSAN